MTDATMMPNDLRAGGPARSRVLADKEFAAWRHTTSGVSWVAILAGAVGAAALSLILLILGVGLGLTSRRSSHDGVNKRPTS